MCQAVRNVSGNAAAVDEVDVVRNRNQVLAGHRDELGVAAVGLQPEDVVGLALIVATGTARPACAAPQTGLQQHAGAGSDRTADRRR